MNALFLLAVLLTPPAETPPLPVAETPFNWAVLKHFALAQEIAGPHERWYGWPAEIAYVRRYYHLLRDAPPLADVDRLPPVEVLRQGLQFNRAYRERMEQQAKGAFAWERAWYEQTLEEAARIGRVYETMLQVRVSSAWAVRRNGLRELRNLLGADAYAAGAWPPPAPPHHFRRID